MTSHSDQPDELEQIRAVPEVILKGIIRMDNPTEEKIRRSLPAQYKKLAGVIHRRLIATSTDASSESNSTTGGAHVAPEPAVDTQAAAHVNPSQSDQAAQFATASTDRTPSHAAPYHAAPSQPMDDPNEVIDGEVVEEDVVKQDDVHPQNAGLDPVAAQFAGLAGGSAAISVMDRSKIIPNITTDYFAPYDFGNTGAGEDTVKVRHREIGDRSTVEVTWDRPAWVEDDMLVVYRVVASDGETDQSPEAGELMVSIVSEGYEEDAPTGVAFRHYQVWMNVGSDMRSTLDSQPTLIGEDICIFPVPGVSLEVSQGVVEGSWEIVPGYEEIRVYGSGKGDRGRANSPEYRIHGGVTYKSFEHRAVPGATMRYMVLPVVKFRGELQVGTRGAVHEVSVPAELTKTELESCAHGQDIDGSERIFLSWFAPRAGVVRVYLSNRAPAADLSFAPVPVEALARDDALAEARTVEEEQPADSQVDHKAMWPDEWDEVHITPVTIVDGMAEVGSTSVLQRVDTIRNATLIERTEEQLITFEWPAGATMVKIETASLGSEDRSHRTHRAEIDEDEYRRTGGVRLNLDPLGQTVILTPRSIYRGEETTADETVLHYRGLRHYRYQLRATPQGMIVHLWCVGRDDQNPPRFQLVHHPERFPLCIEDKQDQGAGVVGIQPMTPGQQPGFNEIGELITPTTLPAGPPPAQGEDPTQIAAGRQPWIVPIDEVRRIGQNPQWLRLFIVEDDAPLSDDAWAVGHSRRIVTDDAAGSLLKLVLPEGQA